MILLVDKFLLFCDQCTVSLVPAFEIICRTVELETGFQVSMPVGPGGCRPVAMNHVNCGIRVNKTVENKPRKRKIISFFQSVGIYQSLTRRFHPRQNQHVILGAGILISDVISQPGSPLSAATPFGILHTICTAPAMKTRIGSGIFIVECPAFLLQEPIF